MSDRFPLVNQRRNHIGTWEPVLVAETHVVPSISPYTIQLKERPSNGVDVPGTTAPTITGLVETTNTTVASGKFFVNYQTGDVTFNSNKAGQTVSVNYYKTGHIVMAEDANLLWYRLVHENSAPTDSDYDYELGTIWVDESGTDPAKLPYYLVSNEDSTAVWVPLLSSIWGKNGYYIEVDGAAVSGNVVLFGNEDGIFASFDMDGNFSVAGLEPGYVKSDVNGTLSGGHGVSITDSNLVASSPLKLTLNTLSHLNTPGSKHIPIGGSENDYLKYSSNGEAEWSPLINIFNQSLNTIDYVSFAGGAIDQFMFNEVINPGRFIYNLDSTSYLDSESYGIVLYSKTVDIGFSTDIGIMTFFDPSSFISGLTGTNLSFMGMETVGFALSTDISTIGDPPGYHRVYFDVTILGGFECLLPSVFGSTLFVRDNPYLIIPGDSGSEYVLETFGGLSFSSELDGVNYTSKIMCNNDDADVLEDRSGTLKIFADTVEFHLGDGTGPHYPKFMLQSYETMIYGVLTPVLGFDFDDSNGDPIWLAFSNPGVVFGGEIIAENLPTSDPGVAGAFWNSSGTLKVSI